MRQVAIDLAKAWEAIDSMYCLFCAAPLTEGHRYEVCSMGYGRPP